MKLVAAELAILLSIMLSQAAQVVTGKFSCTF